ncbi:uncharacterized protein [Nicotiana tomentosiformis]|uniref:uncharacterized protein isoform X3 n=1 Tax=Nicotiana tomentosiformis TaxID=4098 RepID=UPI00051BB538|nr:uncharacterized protein LOC104099013 isoform X2 [Nicotiana tomentosiformis]
MKTGKPILACVINTCCHKNFKLSCRRTYVSSFQRTSQIVLMAPEEEKTIRRSPLDFPILSPSVSFSGNQTMPKTQLLCLQVTVVLDLHHIPSPVSDVGYGGNF